MKYIILFTTILFLTGCSAHTLIKPGEINLGKINVKTSSHWSQRKFKGELVWTKDGALLNRISIREIQNGKHIFNEKIGDNNRGFVYNSDLNLEDTLELYLDALETSGVANPNLSHSQRRFINEREALDFEFSYDTEQNLKYISVGTFIKDDNSVSLILCSAPKEYYFPTFEMTFRDILASIEIN